MKSISRKAAHPQFTGYYCIYKYGNDQNTYFDFDHKHNIMRVTVRGRRTNCIYKDNYFSCTYEEFKKYPRLFPKPF